MLPDLAIAPLRRVLYGQEAIIYSCSASSAGVQVFLAKCTVITTIASASLRSASCNIQLDFRLTCARSKRLESVGYGTVLNFSENTSPVRKSFSKSQLGVAESQLS
jgi:hypothetical protein